MLPIHFGHWRTVYGRFRELARRFLFQTIHDVERMLDREQAGREASPTAGVIDSQSIKAPHSKTRDYDVDKQIVGRKRHIAVDTDGRLLMDKAAYLDFVIEITRRRDEAKGFEVLPVDGSWNAPSAG